MPAAASTDDFALEPVPAELRKGWGHLAWGTTGIVTTLASLFIGALATFVAGLKLALLAGLAVTSVGLLLGWALGHIACKTGLSSTMIARRHGFSIRGAIVPAALSSFMMVGFIGIENALLYRGLLSFLGARDTLALRIQIYCVLALIWVVLTRYGFRIVTRTASLAQVAFLSVLAYMLVKIVGGSHLPLTAIGRFPTQFSPTGLAALSVHSEWDKFLFCVNLMIAQAGALALVAADLGRYAKRSQDIGIAALLGGLCMNVLSVATGGIIMFAGMPVLTHYYMHLGLSAAQARHVALESPDQITTAFIVFAGLLGTALMVFAQLKAQVLNTYSASLSLTTLADALFRWRPGRFLFVIFANIAAFAYLFGDAAVMFQSFLHFLGIAVNCLVTVMLTDYFVVSPRIGLWPETEQVNWAGVGALAIGIVGCYLAPPLLSKLPFLLAVSLTFVAYVTGRLLLGRRSRMAQFA